MKHQIISIILLLIISNIAYSQSLIKTSKTKVANTQRVQLLNSRIAVTDIESIDINLNALREKKVDISFLDFKETVTNIKTNVRDIKNFSWQGKSSDKQTSVLLSVMGEDIQGIITHNTDMYRIETLGNQYIITRIDQSMYPDEGCYDSETNDKLNAIIKQTPNLQPKGIQNSPNSQSKISGEPFSCNVRVLVLYTPAADSLSSNILNTIQLAVDETNTSYENSEIDMEIELAYVGSTNYTEEHHITDVVRFANNNDGFMDEVHELRELHQADICVLIEDVLDYCGVAVGLLANTNNAFATADWDCATGYYSFGHEIGHLIGAQHAPEDPVDANHAADFPYAHGYKRPDKSWRTIMAYSCSSGCTRLPYWSNPSVNHPTDSIPMGIVDTCDNARMLREHHSTIMTLLQPETNLTIDNISATTHQGDIIAINNIVTSDTVKISDQQAYSFRASNTICLNAGFWAEDGCEFVAEIVDVTECGSTSSRLGQFKSTEQEEELSNTTISVYPNPTSDHINLSFSLDKETYVDIVIYDFLGKRIQQTGAQLLNSGAHQQSYSLVNLASGIYFISVAKENGEVMTKKIIKK